MERAPVLGILTRDYTVYSELVRYLKRRDIPFLSLSSGTEIPETVGAIVSTEAETSRVPFSNVVSYRSARQAVEEARKLMTGTKRFRVVVVGIDPGDRPGIAIFADGRELRAYQVPSPEAVEREVRRILSSYRSTNPVLRIGHGAKTARDRIINTLLDFDARIEIVDETATSPAVPRAGVRRDIAAARAIALSSGREVRDRRAIAPGAREIRDIQRKSRIASHGEVTISRDLALRVARGELSLEQAIRQQRAE